MVYLMKISLSWGYCTLPSLLSENKGGPDVTCLLWHYIGWCFTSSTQSFDCRNCTFAVLNHLPFGQDQSLAYMYIYNLFPLCCSIAPFAICTNKLDRLLRRWLARLPNTTSWSTMYQELHQGLFVCNKEMIPGTCLTTGSLICVILIRVVSVCSVKAEHWFTVEWDNKMKRGT